MSGTEFQKQVDSALARMAGIGIKNLAAKVDGKVVTLTGTADDMADKTKAMTAFNTFVVTENTINMIRIDAPPAATPASSGGFAASVPAAAPPAAAVIPPHAETQRVHMVEKGDTLSAIAKKYYGKSSDYMRIFEANKDVLDNPDRIFPGQRLRIP